VGSAFSVAGFETARSPAWSKGRSVISEDEVGEWLRQGKYDRVFEAAVAEFRHKVFRLAFSMLHDEAAAADATQDTFLRIWRSLAAFEGRCALSTWVYSIARNPCLNHAGQKAARKEDLFIDRATARSTASDDRRLVEQLLSALPAGYRRVLTLYYLEERSYEEVAAILDMPVGTVKTYLHRAKRQLGEVYGGLRRL
jgi:RNA polymerase sigma-70 factor (ECF subfamily)